LVTQNLSAQRAEKAEVTKTVNKGVESRWEDVSRPWLDEVRLCPAIHVRASNIRPLVELSRQAARGRLFT